MDEELEELLGTVRKKTWILVVMLIGAALYVQAHVKHDLEQEKEIWRLNKYVSHLEHQTSIYYQRIKTLEREGHMGTPP